MLVILPVYLQWTFLVCRLESFDMESNIFSEQSEQGNCHDCISVVNESSSPIIRKSSIRYSFPCKLTLKPRVHCRTDMLFDKVGTENHERIKKTKIIDDRKRKVIIFKKDTWYAAIEQYQHAGTLSQHAQSRRWQRRLTRIFQTKKDNEIVRC